MKAGAKTTEATRILWSLVLGLGLVLGLLWVMMPRSAAEAQTDIGPGLIVGPSSAVVLPVSTPVPMPPRPFSPPLGGRKGGTSPRNPPVTPSENGPSPLSPASARIPEGPAPGQSASSTGGSPGYSGAATSALYATKGVTGPHIRLEKNEDYYDAAGVVITQVTSLFIDEDEAWSQYQSGELDTITPPDSELDAIKASPVYSPHLHVYPRQCTYYYGFSNDVPPFDDPLVRAAFASAIDRPRLISETGTLSGDELEALTFTPPGSFGHVDGYAAGVGRPYSPTLAQDLLAASGYTGTPTITLMYNTSPGHQAIAEAIRQMWIDTLGITVTLQDMEWGSYLDLLSNGSADERPGIFRLGWCADYPDAHNWHNDAMSSNRPRYNNPSYNAVVSAAATETLTTTRLNLYQQAESYLVMTDTAISPLYYYVGHDLTRPDLARTYRSFGAQHLDEWTITSTLRPLEIVWGGYSPTLDPALASDTVSINYIEQLFLGLTDFDSETGAVAPELATSWDVSADGTVYTFTMRSDVTWTNSISVVTAYDVEYGILRTLDPATGCDYAFVLYLIENAQEYNWGDITDPDLVGVGALDDTHIRFTLTGPASYFPAIAGLWPARPQPQWAIETHGGAWTAPENIVTNGPYKLVAWEGPPHLRINKWGDGTPQSGDNFVFHIEYRNDGADPAENSVITDTMLGGMTYISDTSPFTHTGSGSGPIVWYLGTLSAHTSGQFEVHVQVTAAPSQTITNQAQIATSNPDDQGDQWEKESEWSGHVEGPLMRVNYGGDWVGGDYPAGHTFWLTVTDSGGTPKATAAISTTVGGARWTGDGFLTESDNWSPSQPDIQPDDRVHFQSDDGYSNTMRVGTITGELDADADTVSGTIHAPWFTQTLQGYAGAWGFPGWENFTVDLDDTGRGHYFVHFSEDLRPGDGVGVEYVEPDGDEVINAIYAPGLAVRVNQSHNWVEGKTTPGSTIVATVWRDGLPVMAKTTDNGGGTHWHIDLRWDHEGELRVGDVVEIQTSQGLTASVEIIPMTGAVDAGADTISGTLFGVPFPADVRGEVCTENGTSVDGTTDVTGTYTLDFSPSFDVLPGHGVALWYIRPDGHQVGIVRHALRLRVDTARDKVEGDTWANVPVTVTVNSETVTTTSDAEGRFWTEFTTDITATDTVEAWAGTGTQYASLVVETVTAYVDDAHDKVWGYGPPYSGSNDNINVGVDGDWRWTSTDGSGYYEVQYDWDITPDDEVEVEYNYSSGHQTRYGFGPPDVRVHKWTEFWEVVPGDEYSYFIEYSNDASGPATDVVITDTLPYSVTYVSDTSGVSPAIVDNTIVWNLGTLGAHRSETFELRVLLDAGAPLWTQLRNRVEIGAPDDRDPGNNWGETDVQTSDQHRVDLWVDKSLGGDKDSEDESPAGLPIPGEVITYQLHYGNHGSLTANNVVLTDTLPASTTFVTTTFEVGVDGLTETVGAGMVVWDIGTLDPGESRQFELAVQIDGGAAPGTLLVNELAISSSDVGEGDHRDDRFRLTTVVEPEMADLWVDKEMEGDFSSITNDFTYRITFGNDGTLAAQDVVITDTLPLSMTRLWHSAGSAATLADGVIVWQLGTVPPGGGGQLLVGVRVSGTVPAGTVFTNTVAGSTSTPELDYDNNVDVDRLGPPRVICVPWIGPRPHRVWSGLNTTLKGTAKGYGLASYEWKPGDGSTPITGWVSDPYIIEANHIYNAPVGTVFTATLTVWGAFGWSDTDTYAVQVFSQTQGVEVDVAVDEGLWYVHKEAQRYSKWGLPFAEWRTSGYGAAETASAIQAFQVQGHRPGGDPWEDPYVEDVQRGWNALFTYSKLDAMTVEPMGDPDSDGDGVGAGMYDHHGSAIYESGLAMLALATTGSPDRVAHTGPPIYVRGQTYYSITQDMADWFAWGQNDDWSGTARGGWRYQPNSGDSDNSNTQFPVLGLAAAEDNWSIAVPTWVKSELRDYWLAYSQSSDGGFGYMGPDGWTNVGKTGAGLMGLAWTGVPVTDTRIISAAQFIEAHWYDTPGNWDGNVGEMYAMYAVKKGSQLAGIHQYGSHFWQTEYDAYLVGVQWPDGHFDDAGDFGGWQPMATSWAVMILSPGLYRPLPVPIISPFHFGGIGDEWNDGKVRFDASLSHHTAPDRTIILYEWDFGDGSTPVTTPDPIITHTYPARNVYVATLTVWDDVYDSASRATQVNITAPDSPPVADPNGPYSGQPGQEIILDGSGSYDPDEWMGDEIVLYEWDIAGGSLYTTTQPTLPYTWLHPGVYSVILRVQDRGADYGLDSPQWSDPEATVATIGPVADLSLTKSDSPDPVVAGESLTYTLVVANNGLLSATNVILTDTLPPGVTFAWATAGCTESGGVVTCDLGNLDPSAIVTVTIVVTPTEPGTIVNFAIVAADECDSDPTDNAASQYTVVTAAPVLDPIVVSITPDSGFNDETTPVAIEGSNFQSGATASLDGIPLQAVTFVSDNLLEATVPAGLTPGTYDLTVVNPDTRSGILLSAFTVLAPTPPIVADVAPSQGPNDTPVTVDVYGSNFAPHLTATLSLSDTQVNLEGLLFIDSTHLRGIVPIYVTPSVYTLTVTNTDGRSGTLPDAYEVIEAAISDDLYANDTDLWLRPSSVRRGDTSALGLTVRRQGGQTDLTNVAVDFYEGDPLVGGNLIGTGTAPVLPPYGAVTTTVSWTPAAADTYVLYAVIDPANAVTEDNEANNVISRTVTVLPPAPDVTPPQVISFTINGGAANTSGRQVYLSVTASDDPGGSGVAGLFYIEYEFVQSVADWAPVASSGWLPYASASTGYPWLLQPGAGVRYLQVWAADAAGNISLMPAAQMINYLPPMAHVAQGQIHIFRQRLTTGQSLRVRLTSFSGDADLYIWAPDGTLVEYSWADNPEVIEFTAGMNGVYQIEVEGWTPADYRLEIIPISVTQAQVMGILRPTARGRGTPYVMPSDTPGENVGLPSAPVTEYRIFLPLVMRQQ